MGTDSKIQEVLNINLVIRREQKEEVDDITEELISSKATRTSGVTSDLIAKIEWRRWQQ